VGWALVYIVIHAEYKTGLPNSAFLPLPSPLSTNSEVYTIDYVSPVQTFSPSILRLMNECMHFLIDMNILLMIFAPQTGSVPPFI
jgi:hypothetical protein